jgi:glycine cleavage system aminomethyltransferase T
LTVGERNIILALPNNDGGVVDDLLIYKMKEEEYIGCKCF